VLHIVDPTKYQEFFEWALVSVLVCQNQILINVSNQAYLRPLALLAVRLILPTRGLHLVS